MKITDLPSTSDPKTGDVFVISNTSDGTRKIEFNQLYAISTKTVILNTENNKIFIIKNKIGLAYIDLFCPDILYSEFDSMPIVADLSSYIKSQQITYHTNTSAATDEGSIQIRVLFGTDGTLKIQNLSGSPHKNIRSIYVGMMVFYK